jgi:NodT family efflux transporter outer membrane factor (OMF) lipoprotein
MSTRSRSCRLLTVAGLLTLLHGCAVGPDFEAPSPPSTPTYTAAPQPAATASSPGPGGAAQRLVAAESVGGAWWLAFRSDALSHLVQQALDDSPTLAWARQKLEQAQQDYLAQSGATQFPKVDARLATTRQQVDPAALGFPGVAQPGPFTLYSASVNVSYTLDLFGANRRALEALMAQVDYQRYELEAARLSLAGNVVTTALRRASLARQIALSEAIAEAQARELAIAEGRYAAGGVARVDLLGQRTLLEQTRATLPPLRKQLAQAEHQLAVYAGRAPADLDRDADAPSRSGALDLDALSLPTELPLTLPSALARQRPDIRAAEALLHQAGANVGVATANLYPQLTLSGSAGAQRTRAGDLLDALNVWSLGAALTQPLFHGGELRARQHSAEAAYEAALASYRQTVLQGLQEVADVLRALQHDADELQSREAAAGAARERTAIARSRFAAGGISELALLDAQRQELQAALDRVKVQAQRYADTAALYQALGARP